MLLNTSTDDLHDAIVRELCVGRISTTEVGDCLGKSGVLPGVTALNRERYATGEVFFTCAVNESNWPVHQQFEHIPPQSIIIVETLHCGTRSPIGALMAMYAIEKRHAAAVVVIGPVRDAPVLIANGWPVWSAGVNPIGCFNEEPQTTTTDSEALSQLRQRYEGGIAVCDASGVVLIPSSRIDLDFFEKLSWIRRQEDVWADCVEKRGWSTFETVCKKRYLDEA